MSCSVLMCTFGFGCVHARGDVRPADLHIISYNVGNVEAPGARPDQVVSTAAPQSPPPVFVLQEVRGAPYAAAVAEAAAARWGVEYTYTVAPRSSLAVVTTGAIIDESSYELAGSEGTNDALLTTVETGGSRVLVAAVHLAPIPKPRTPDGYVELRLSTLTGIVLEEMFSETDRSRAIETLLPIIERRAAEAHVDAVVAAGDFNTIPASRALRSMRNHYVDALADTADASTGTYWKVRFPLRPRVDFIFVSTTVSVVDGGVIRERWADHFPVYARILIPSQRSRVPGQLLR